MLTLFLVDLIIILLCVEGFTYLIKNTGCNFKLSLRHRNHFMKTMCYDNDNDEKSYKKNRDMNMKKIVEMDLSDEPIYTLIWYDCPECKQLLDIMDQENKKSIYINASYYFYDDNEDILVNKPLFYKDEEFISDDLFDIYMEIMK